MANPLPPGKRQFFDANGNPLAAGQVFYYVPATTTPKNTWQDDGETILNTNPVVLDAAGEAIIFGSGAYRELVKDSAGNIIWDQLTYGYISKAMEAIVAAATVSALNTLIGNFTHGQCRLARTNATTLTFSRYNGSWLIINGTPQQIPAGGVTLSNAGLAASTLVYIYAFMNGATMTLEASTTGHSTDATTGVEIKTADATRTLVGVAFPDGSSQFNDSATLRNVASYFNRQAKPLQGVDTNVGLTATGTLAEITSAARVEVTQWSDGPAQLSMNGSITSAGTNTGVYNIGRDGIVTLLLANNVTQIVPIAGNIAAVSGSAVDNTAGGEGHHYFTPLGFVSAGTITTHLALQGAVWS